MNEGLRYILDKQIVVPTVNADDLLNQSAHVDAEYTAHAYTFIPMGDMDEIAKRLIKQISSGKTVKGMLIAPYGYGKTSTLVFLWYACHTNGLLAIPPFYCSSLLDMLRATYGWAKYQFGLRAPGLLPNLDDLFQRHYGATLEEKARSYAKEFGVTVQAALGILQRQQASGEYRIQLTATALQAFLQDLTALALSVGWRGVILFPDEFQAFVGRTESVRQTLQSLRELVWALNSTHTADGGKPPLGVLISADDTTEGRIRNGGGDILDRLREDGFYLNLRTIYDQNFPQALWQRYIEAFKLSAEDAKVIDAPTLRALGQIAERDDLSRGPRTVIDAFKGAIRHRDRTTRSYTPMDLIDDFLEDRIRFDAEGNRLKQATKQALAVSTVTTTERRQAIKLLAAFPRGVSRETQEHYGLTKAINELSKGGGHGELMTLLIEGYTLLGLLRQGDGGRHVVDRIIAQFGRDYEADEAHAEAALRAFEQYGLGKIFATRRGAQSVGWDALTLSDAATGSRYGTVDGSFAPQYPRRKVVIQLANEQKHLKAEHDQADLQFDFLLHWRDTPTGTGDGSIERVGQRTLRWHLALKHPLEGEMPGDIKKLQEFVNPAFISPLLMLSLITYIGAWEQTANERIPENDQSEIKLLVDRMVDRSLAMLFNQGMHSGWSGELKRASTGLVEEVFTAWMRERYPAYVTFFNHAQYQEMLRKYQDAIKGLPKKASRGHVPMTRDKNEWARLFGASSVSIFENWLETVYKPLLRKIEWSGNRAILQCQLHPLEQAIMRQLAAEGQPTYLDGTLVQAVNLNSIKDQAVQVGYRQEEVAQAFQLLFARRMIGTHSDKKLAFIPADAVSNEKLQSDVAEQQQRLADLPVGLLPLVQANELLKQAGALANRLEGQTDEEELDEVQHYIAQLREKITESVIAQRSELELQLRKQRDELETCLARMKALTDQIEPAVQGQVGFVQHISALRMELTKLQAALRKDLDRQRTVLTGVLESKTDDPVQRVVGLQKHVTHAVTQTQGLVERFATLKAYADGLARWREEVLKQADTLFAAHGLPVDLRTQLTQSLVPLISEYLTKHALGGLKDWEVYKGKLNELTKQFSARQTVGNQEFGLVKDELARVLREIKVPQSAMRARYEYGADTDSYKDLFSETRDKVISRLNEIQTLLDELSTDLVRVEYLQALDPERKTTLKRLKQQHQALLTQLQTARAELTVQLIEQHRPATRETSAFTIFAQQLQKLDGAYAELRGATNKLFAVDPARTSDEERFMGLLEGRQDYDLAALFLSLRRDQEVQLDAVLNLLRDLFKKGQVEVKVRRRSN